MKDVIVVGIPDKYLQDIISKIEKNPECKSLKKMYTSFQFFKEYNAGDANVIFVDTSIPDTDIRPFAKRIKEIDPKVILIGIAKHKDHIMIRQFKEIKDSDFILKTDPNDELINKIFSTNSTEEVKKKYISLDSDTSTKNKKILVVDDFENTLDVIKYTLELAGFKVLTASSGRQALNIMNKDMSINLLVTDLNMPQMNGFEVIEEARKIPQYENLPIFILTTEFDMEKKIRAKRLNITGWIQKPYNITDFVDIIKKALS